MAFLVTFFSENSESHESESLSESLSSVSTRFLFARFVGAILEELDSQALSSRFSSAFCFFDCGDGENDERSNPLSSVASLLSGFVEEVVDSEALDAGLASSFSSGFGDAGEDELEPEFCLRLACPISYLLL